jgi:hypothetical protein
MGTSLYLMKTEIQEGLVSLQRTRRCIQVCIPLHKSNPVSVSTPSTPWMRPPASQIARRTSVAVTFHNLITVTDNIHMWMMCLYQFLYCLLHRFVPQAICSACSDKTQSSLFSAYVWGMGVRLFYVIYFAGVIWVICTCIMNSALNYTTTTFLTNFSRTNLDGTLCSIVIYRLVLLSLGFYI